MARSSSPALEFKAGFSRLVSVWLCPSPTRPIFVLPRLATAVVVPFHLTPPLPLLLRLVLVLVRLVSLMLLLLLMLLMPLLLLLMLLI